MGKILVMLDKDGDENYQPMFIPLTGGFPEPAFGGQLADDRVHLQECDAANHIVYFNAEARHEALGKAYRGHLTTGQLELLGQSRWGLGFDAVNADHTQVILSEGYLPPRF